MSGGKFPEDTRCFYDPSRSLKHKIFIQRAITMHLDDFDCIRVYSGIHLQAAHLDKVCRNVGFARNLCEDQFGGNRLSLSKQGRATNDFNHG